MTTDRETARAIVESGRHVVIAGAGVSREAGLPLWPSALAEIADRLDQLGHKAKAAVMREDAADGRYLQAAEQLYLAKLTEDERDAVLQGVFNKKSIPTARLTALAATPCLGFVSTNYDLSLMRACPPGATPLTTFGREPADLSAVRTTKDRFFLRLHGRIEVPSTVVLAQRHYEALVHDAAYKELFHWVFNQDSIWFGFSFADPAFTRMLAVLAAASGHRVRRRSFALLSQNPEPLLARLLEEAGIKVLPYSSADQHAEGWSLVSHANSSAPHVAAYDLAESALRSKLAYVLAHLRLHKDRVTRTEVLAVVALDAIQRQLATKGSAPCDEIVDNLIEDLVFPQDQRAVLLAAVRLLISDKRLEEIAGQVRLPATPPPADQTGSKAGFGDSGTLSELATSVLARASMRYNVRVNDLTRTRAAITEVITRVLVADGLAIGHQLFRGHALDEDRVDTVVASAIRSLGSRDRSLVVGFADAIQHLLTAPDVKDEQLLDEANAACLTLSLLFTDPAIIAVAESALNRTVFLDTSILLPWICDGHVAAPFYSQIIGGLANFLPRVARGYLNEVVSHRKIALDLHSQHGLSDMTRLEEYARFARVEGMNAFLGGWSGLVASGRHETFKDYLARVAPYTDEVGAAKHLEGMGVQIFDLPRADVDMPTRERVESEITRYLREQNRPREPLVVRHDADMLAFLADRIEPADKAALFITADRALLRAVSGFPSGLRDVLGSVWLPHQAASAVELAGRSRGHMRGFSRTLWNLRVNDAARLREFYIDRILLEYEPALAQDIQVVVDQIVDEVTRSGRLVAGADDPSSGRTSLEGFRALDQFEPRFHQLMEAARQRLSE
jgi:hypothetical protein